MNDCRERAEILKCIINKTALLSSVIHRVSNFELTREITFFKRASRDK